MTQAHCRWSPVAIYPPFIYFSIIRMFFCVIRRVCVCVCEHNLKAVIPGFIMPLDSFDYFERL